MAFSDRERALAEWCRSSGAEAFAVIDRDGRTVAGSLPPHLRTELFGVVCATMFGAAAAATAELGDSLPAYVQIRTEGRQTILAPFGPQSLLCVVAGTDLSPPQILEGASHLWELGPTR